MWRLLFAAFAFTPIMATASNVFLPLTRVELARTFRLKAFPFSYPHVQKLGSTTISVNHPKETVEFRGKDKSGKAWSVHTHSSTIGWLFQADLDKNGESDLIYIAYTGGAGSAPTERIVFLCFDIHGRPISAEFEGNISYTEKGIDDLLDLDNNGQAEFLRQELDDGYWITSLYEFRDTRIQLVTTPHAGRSYPLYTRYTFKPNNVSVTPKPPRHPRRSDLSNIPLSAEPIVLSSIQHNSENGTMKIQTARDQSYCALLYQRTFMVTIDSSSSRRSATIGAFDYSRPLLNEIIRKRLPALFSGRRVQGREPLEDCVESIWASDGSAQ